MNEAETEAKNVGEPGKHVRGFYDFVLEAFTTIL